MPTELSIDVLIVGAGPTGLTLACELARRGLSIRIVDQKMGPSPESRALGVHARTLELWEKLGVADRAVEAGLPLRGANIHNQSRLIGQVRLSSSETRYPYVLSLPQSETERLLVARLRELGAAVQWQTRLVDLVDQVDYVSTVLENEHGQRETIDAAWVVGCDGAHSTVRKAVGIPFAGTRLPEWFALADVVTDWQLPRDQISLFASPRGSLAVFPLPSERTYRIVAPLPDEPVEREPNIDPSRVEEIVWQRSEQRVALRESPWISSFLISRRIVDRYRAGHVFLAGDAAHVHSPVGGQGMNTGIQDAFNLAWKLALVRQGLAAPELLNSYDQERRPIGERTLRGTARATRLVTLKNRFAQRIRDRVMAAITRQSWIGPRLFRTVSMLDIHYRASVVVEDALQVGTLEGVWGSAGKLPRAGDRMPDFSIRSPGGLASISRLHELLRTFKHVLLLFSNAAGDVSHGRLGGIARRYSELVESFQIAREARNEDCRAEWIERFIPDGITPTVAGLLRREAVLLVRPDGYIGWRGGLTRTDALEAYLERWFRASSPPLKPVSPKEEAEETEAREAKAVVPVA